jgi:hypothetical protein
MRRVGKVLLVSGGVVALALLSVAASLYNISDIAHQSIRFHLRLLGASIYEYHSRTGRWPAQAEDLAETSLPVQSPYWKVMLDAGTNVIVWHDNLKPDPKDNAGVILVYHNRGLLAWLGRHWVCWGDLRTEYITNRKLQASLQAARQ